MQLELNELREKVSRLETVIEQINKALHSAQHPPLEEEPLQLPARPQISTTRRRALKKLAAGLVAGVALATATTGSDLNVAQASVASNPSSKIGAVILPKGASFSGSPSTANRYGVIASTNSAVNLSILDTNLGSNAVVGITTSFFGNGVYGLSASPGAGGVFGQNISTGKGFGIVGFSTTATGIGVWGDSSTNLGSNGLSQIFPSGVVGTCPTGYGVVANGGLAPLYLTPGSNVGAPATGNHRAGEFYADNTGALFYCYSGDGTSAGSWKQLAP